MQRLVEFKARSKVVVLLTDGESNIHDIDEDAAIDDAVKAGIKVYTIGAGTTGVAPICADRGDGRNTLMQMPVSIDELAAHDRRQDRWPVLPRDGRREPGRTSTSRSITSSARRSIRSSSPSTYQYYPWFLGAALVMIAAALLLRATVLRRLP